MSSNWKEWLQLNILKLDVEIKSGKLSTHETKQLTGLQRLLIDLRDHKGGEIIRLGRK